MMTGLLLLLLGAVAWSWALQLQTVEDNCIYSFVVPREQVKHSCQLDDKVSRRLGAMEMKTNDCKREVIQLTTQLEKERELTTSKLQQLERRFGLDSKSVDFLVDRLGLLEKQIEQLHADIIKSKKTNMADDGSHVNAIETIPTVKSLLQLEVKGMYENLSKRLEAYIKEQVVLYTTVLGTVHKMSQGKTTGMRKPASAAPVKTTPAPPSGDTTEIDEVVSKANATEDEMAQQVGNVSISSEDSPSPLDLMTTASYEELSTASYEELATANSSELVIKDDMSGANDSFSGENLELNETVALTEISAARIGAGPGSLVLTDAKSVDDNETSDERESMLRDQTYRQAELEERLKEEISKTLLSQLAEFIGVVEKRTAALEEKIQSQDEKNQAVATNISSKVKDLDQSVKDVMEQTDTLSQDLVASSQQLDKVRTLESLVYELKKNISGEGLSMAPLEIEEQIKKIKKMERLMSVYNKSLEPLQNETKVRYREMRDLLDKESAGLRSAVKAVQDSISAALDKLNYTHSEKLFDIKGRVRALEDNVVILQVDGSNMQRKINQLPRLERESGDLQAAIRDLSSKQRELKKKLDEVDHQQKSMADYINGTAKQVSDLKTEVKLNILGEWLPMAFEFDSSRTDCHGDQYIKRVDYKAVRLVGVVLCSPTRYKIFLANTLQSKFLNVGDANGLGEDHCEFVGASRDVTPKLSPFRTVHYSVQGYARGNWGQEPTLHSLNALRPSPDWYECGVTIP
ncbi:major antigen-like [Physella acuta]|uniref:major antigen-like n=1 Tax=Physella acuta TaxID=109671 RepID=UPI0027DD5C0C|nr:major antigen-like [Physella acuta]